MNWQLLCILVQLIKSKLIKVTTINSAKNVYIVYKPLVYTLHKISALEIDECYVNKKIGANTVLKSKSPKTVKILKQE